MPYANNPQKAAIAALCAKLGIDKETKAELVKQFSYERTTTSKELYYNEARQMIDHLSRKVRPDTRRDAMVGKILYYCHEMGWTKQSSKTAKQVADVRRFDEWAVKYSYLHKKLERYTYKELPTLVSQFESVYKSWLKTI